MERAAKPQAEHMRTTGRCLKARQDEFHAQSISFLKKTLASAG